MAASELGDDAVGTWIADALTSNADVLPYVLVGCANVSEQRDSRDIHSIIGISYSSVDLPARSRRPTATDEVFVGHEADVMGPAGLA